MTTKIPAELSSTPGISDSSNATAITIDSSENVGIGLTAPSDYYSTQLVISTPNNGGITLAATATTASNYVMFADGTSGTDRYKGYVSYGHNADELNLVSSGYTRFFTSSSQIERMRIDSSGNIGIGTTSPNEKLEVAGNLTLTPSSKSNSPSANATISNINFVGRTDNTVVAKIEAIHNDNANGTDGQILFYTADNTSSAAAAEKMRIDSTGNLKFDSGFGSAGKAYGVRAWARFNGNSASGTPSGGNVSSFTRTATGNFTINMTTAMPDTNYAVAGLASQSCLLRGDNVDLASSTTAVKIEVTTGNGASFANADEIHIMVVR